MGEGLQISSRILQVRNQSQLDSSVVWAEEEAQGSTQNQHVLEQELCCSYSHIFRHRLEEVGQQILGGEVPLVVMVLVVE